MIWDPINKFNTATFSCLSQTPGFPTSYVVVIFGFNDLRSEVIVRFVDSVGIVEHHC